MILILVFHKIMKGDKDFSDLELLEQYEMISLHECYILNHNRIVCSITLFLRFAFFTFFINYKLTSFQFYWWVSSRYRMSLSVFKH